MIKEILLVSAVGGLLSMDRRVMLQLMLSQPLITAPIIGYLLGNLHNGLIIGAVLQLLWLGLFPVGANVPPDSCLTSIIATGVSIFLCRSGITEDINFIFAISIVVAIPFGFISRWLEIFVRELNLQLENLGTAVIHRKKTYQLSYINILGLLIAFLKSFTVSLFGLLICIYLLPKVIATLPIQFKSGLHSSWQFLPYLGLAVVLNLFISNRYLLILTIGFIVGLLLKILWI